MAQKGNIPRSYMMFQNLNEFFYSDWAFPEPRSSSIPANQPNLNLPGTTLIVDSS